MKTVFFFCLILIVYLLPAQSLGPVLKFSSEKKIKTITGRGYVDYKEDTVVILKESYDRKGNLLEHSEPLNYCGEVNTYDSLNRLMTSELMCGESSGNGTYTFSYTDSTRTEFFDGPVWESKILVKYKNGRIKEEIYIQDNFGYPDKLISKTTSTTKYTYTFNSKGLLMEEKKVETSIYEDHESNSRPDTTMDTIVTHYFYTPFDSLEKVEKKINGIEETITCHYDAATHRKTDVYFSAVNTIVPDNTALQDSYRHEQFLYDTNGLQRHLLFRYMVDNNTIMELPNPYLEEEFRDGLLISSGISYGDSGTEHVRYTYEFWE